MFITEAQYLREKASLSAANQSRCGSSSAHEEVNGDTASCCIWIGLEFSSYPDEEIHTLVAHGEVVLPTAVEQVVALSIHVKDVVDAIGCAETEVGHNAEASLLQIDESRTGDRVADNHISTAAELVSFLIGRTVNAALN